MALLSRGWIRASIITAPGHDDEVKHRCHTRAIEICNPNEFPSVDRPDPPTVLNRSVSPGNPGASPWLVQQRPRRRTNSAYLKKCPPKFYIWTHAYDVNGITNRLESPVDNDA